MPIPPEWYDDDPSPRTDAEMEKSYGKDWRQKLRDAIASNPHGYGEAEAKDEPDEDKPVDTTDKFLPRRR